LLTVWGVLIVGTGLLTVNLFHVQVQQSSVLQKIARQQQQVFLRPFIPRRQILDRQGNVLAVDRPVYTLYAHPKLFKQPKDAIAEQLAPLLNKPVATVLNRFNQGPSGLQIEYSLSENVADRITDLQLDGLELLQQQERFYPQRQLAAEVVGYVDVDHKGQAGIELSQQQLLERTVKAVRLTRMGDGSLMPDQVPGGFLNVDDLHLQLTIDTRLQKAAIAALKPQIKSFNAKRGTVIVMDVRDGSLLTLASEPSYDPNHYSDYPVERFKNWALADLYEPGSTFKPINVAIALESGSIQADSVFNDEGQIYVEDWPIENFDFSYAGGRGSVSVTDIIKYSSNVGMVHIVQQIKPLVYYTWLKRLGLGELVGIELASEAPGQFKDRKTFLESKVARATTAFGQGFSLTPLQLAQLHGALANGGKLVMPHVMQGLFNSKGQLYWQPTRPTPRQVFSPKTTQAVLAMMEQVVKNGTAKNAQIDGYRIAGKTGTAQKANPGGGYYENAKITSFVGIFPVEAPRYVVVAVVDEPQGGDAFGSTVAAPIVKTMIEALITQEKIPPSQPLDKQTRDRTEEQ
jgi:cell division protein FtsI (penicillin-binding protein 3)